MIPDIPFQIRKVFLDFSEQIQICLTNNSCMEMFSGFRGPQINSKSDANLASLFE
jgi:hypothetical protein